MIEVANVTKYYGNFKALDNVSFNVAKGEVVGLLGPNGAGKTTMMRILTGYYPANAGTATLGGYEVHENPMEVKKLIGYLPENPPLHFEMRVKEYLKFVAEIKHVPSDQIASRMDYAMEAVKITDRAQSLIGTLSKGYKQRVGLAQALLGDPKVLILDEPTIGLDPNQIVDIRNLILSLQEGRTIILSTHILQEVTAVCEKIVMINQGQIVAEAPLKNLVMEDESSYDVIVRVKDKQDEAIKTIEGIDGVLDVTESGQGLDVKVSNMKEVKPEIAKALVKKHIDILEISSDDLAYKFKKLTKLAPEEKNKNKLTLSAILTSINSDLTKSALFYIGFIILLDFFFIQTSVFSWLAGGIFLIAGAILTTPLLFAKSFLKNNMKSSKLFSIIGGILTVPWGLFALLGSSKYNMAEKLQSEKK